MNIEFGEIQVAFFIVWIKIVSHFARFESSAKWRVFLGDRVFLLRSIDLLDITTTF